MAKLNDGKLREAAKKILLQSNLTLVQANALVENQFYSRSIAVLTQERVDKVLEEAIKFVLMTNKSQSLEIIHEDETQLLSSQLFKLDKVRL